MQATVRTNRFGIRSLKVALVALILVSAVAATAVLTLSDSGTGDRHGAPSAVTAVSATPRPRLHVPTDRGGPGR
jgi:hypothetical protein